MTNNSIKEKLAGAVLTIDLNAIVANYSLLRDKAKNARVGAVVKANAYGTGMSRVAPVLAAAGCEIFFVAHVSEGIKLRNLLPDVQIHVLNGLLSGTEEAYVQHTLIPVLGSIDEIDSWINFFGDARHTCDLHVDTGMLRLGLPAYELEQLLENTHQLEKLSINLVLSHLASADIENSPQNMKQLEVYKLARQNIEVPRKSINVNILEITLNKILDKEIDFSVTCSKGTYIRVLGQDIATKLGTIGYLTKLLRITVGPYKVNNSTSIKNFEEKWKSIDH